MQTRNIKARRNERLVAEFDSQKESVTLYCKRHGININTFYYWRKHLHSIPGKPVPAFIPAVIKHNKPIDDRVDLKRPRIIARLPNGITLSIPLLQDASQLKEIVSTLLKGDRQ